MVPEPFDRLRNHSSKGSMSATLITFGTASSLSRPAPYLCKNQFEDSSYKGLNKKQLGKEGKRKIKAHEAQPLNQSDMNLKSIVVRIVKESSIRLIAGT